MRLAPGAALCTVLVAFALVPGEVPRPTPDSAENAALPVTETGREAAESAAPSIDAAGGEAMPEPPVEAGAPTASGPSADAEQPRRRSRRWHRINRYPGPIPTPEEWEPPEGPVRIGLQVGHWRTEEAPPELSGLRSGGTRWESTHEWEVNLAIARAAAEMLREEGYDVDVLPAVVPPGYRAHLFISIHADGSPDTAARGYRIAAPGRDATGRAQQVVDLMERTYGASTGLRLLPDVTRRMRYYYAFNFRRYEHALHPMTIAVILETGFLTSPEDRRVIVDDPERAARGIVEAVRSYDVTRLP